MRAFCFLFRQTFQMAARAGGSLSHPVAALLCGSGLTSRVGVVVDVAPQLAGKGGAVHLHAMQLRVELRKRLQPHRHSTLKHEVEAQEPRNGTSTIFLHLWGSNTRI